MNEEFLSDLGNFFMGKTMNLKDRLISSAEDYYLEFEADGDVEAQDDMLRLIYRIEEFYEENSTNDKSEFSMNAFNDFMSAKEKSNIIN